jgi:hypothetical protein
MTDRLRPTMKPTVKPINAASHISSNQAIMLRFPPFAAGPALLYLCDLLDLWG